MILILRVTDGARKVNYFSPHLCEVVKDNFH